MPESLSIAILGTRGIPNKYGGFEACAEHLGLGLTERGHKVAVYSASDHPEKDQQWRGIRRIIIKNPENKLGSFGQFIYDLRCNLHSRKEGFDVILHMGYTSDSVWYCLWPKQSIHLVNMDGQEWKRPKYNAAVRAFLKYAEKLATIRSQWLIADSKPIQEYLEKKYTRPVRYIAYGAIIPAKYDQQQLGKLGFVPHQYDLMIARMEPENNIETTIKAKLEAADGIPLVIIGNENQYKQFLQKHYGQNKNIVFQGAIYDKEVTSSLRHYSRLYIHGHSVGGTNPSLLEAMACECKIAAHKNPFNESVLGMDAYYFADQEDLVDIFLKNSDQEHRKWRNNNLSKIRKNYQWDGITESYENLIFDAINNR